MTTNKIDATTVEIIEILQAAAVSNGEIQFGHLCAAALCGERWAETRMLDVIDACDGLTADGVLAVVRFTDTTRPDGAIARGVVEV